MGHSTFVTLQHKRIHVAQRDLEPVGIQDGSHCRAVWLPDWRPSRHIPSGAEGSAFQPDHLLISPFHTDSWPVLFRVELRVDDRAGSLLNATRALARKRVNVLSIEATPAGHSHALVVIIGEAVELKNKCNEAADGLLQSSKIDEKEALQAKWNYANKTLAPTMLKFADELRNDLEEEHKATNDTEYLYKPFLEFDGRPRGALYDHTIIPIEAKDLAEFYSIKAVTCVWLQTYAYFWLHAPRPWHGKVMVFTYDAQRGVLKPDTMYAEKYFIESLGERYVDRVRDFTLPAKAVATVNTDEKYLRISPSKFDHPNKTALLRISYSATFSNNTESTLGLLNHICATLHGDGYNLRRVWMTTTGKSANSEEGRLAFAISASGAEETLSNEQLESLRTTFEARTDFGARKLKLQKIQCDQVAVGRFGARKLFLSTSFEWKGQPRPKKLFELLETELGQFGFDVVYSTRGKQGGQAGDSSISDRTMELIRKANVFLQIIPLVARKRNKMQWLLFELGAAAALGVPLLICVECDDEVQLDDWRQLIRVRADHEMFPFQRDDDIEDIVNHLSNPIEQLAKDRRFEPPFYFLEY